MGDKKTSFAPEIGLYRSMVTLISFFESLLDRKAWIMSPSRFYSAIAETITWLRKQNVWHFDQPAFLYVVEQCEQRAQSLQGTHDDVSREMEMSVWRDREAPIPGGTYSIFQIFDWFFPILRMAEGKMVEYFGNPDETANGHEFTEYEAWNVVFMIVDKLYKDPHFGKINGWGQPEAYPWVDFVRDEMYEMNQILKPTAPPPPAGYEPPFSLPS